MKINILFYFSYRIRRRPSVRSIGGHVRVGYGDECHNDELRPVGAGQAPGHPGTRARRDCGENRAHLRDELPAPGHIREAFWMYWIVA